MRAPARVVHACARGRCAAGRSALQHLVPGPRGYTLVAEACPISCAGDGATERSMLTACAVACACETRARGERVRERAVYAPTRGGAPPADAGHCIMCSRCVWRVRNTHVYRDSFVHCPRPCRARGWRAGRRAGRSGKNHIHKRAAGMATTARLPARRLSSRRTAGFDKTHAGRQGERDPGENTDGGGAARRPPSLSPPSRTAVNTRSRLCAQSSLSSDRRHSPSPAHAHDHTECN